jgi:hypothetical protein
MKQSPYKSEIAALAHLHCTKHSAVQVSLARNPPM